MLVLALVKNMNIRVIEEVATPTFMALPISSFPFHLRTLFLSLLIFTIRSHPLSSMLAQGHAYFISILIFVLGRTSFRPYVCTSTTFAMFLMQHTPRPH